MTRAKFIGYSMAKEVMIFMGYEQRTNPKNVITDCVTARHSPEWYA
jgi:hypothetical protein